MVLDYGAGNYRGSRSKPASVSLETREGGVNTSARKFCVCFREIRWREFRWREIRWRC